MRDNVHCSSQVVAMEEPGDVCYLLGDRQGSKRVVLTNTGGVMARHDYLAYGQEVASTIGMRDSATQKYGVPDNARQRYAQTEDDKATGLEHAKWRKMESNAGRWTSPDPYRGSMRKGNPQSLNRYAYVDNDPVNASDPSGLFSFEANYNPSYTNFYTGGGGVGFFQTVYSGGTFSPLTSIYDLGTNITPIGMAGSLPSSYGSGGYTGGGGGAFVPQNSTPCPSVPEGPANANLDANIQEAARRYSDSQSIPLNPDAGQDPMSSILAHATWFALQVMPGGTWDYKQQSPSGTQLYTPFGNVHYGAVGRAAGFSEATLLRAAGYVQKIQAMLGTSPPGDGGRVGLINILLGRGGDEPFEDQLEDQENIKRGVNYHDSKFVRKDCQ